MSKVRPHHGMRVAVLVRLSAFIVAAASVVLIPSSLAAAAAGHVGAGTALAATGAAASLSLLTSFAARRLDPMRG